MTIDLPSLSFGALATALAMLFALGAVPVFTARLIVRIYPKSDPRRREIVAEMAHVKRVREIPEQWMWLGQTFAQAVCEGVPHRIKDRNERVRARGGRSAMRALGVFLGLIDNEEPAEAGYGGMYAMGVYLGLLEDTDGRYAEFVPTKPDGPSALSGEGQLRNWEPIQPNTKWWHVFVYGAGGPPTSA